MADHETEVGWEQGWEGHRDAQLRRLARLSLAEKLAWLEAAQETAIHLSSQARGRRERESPAEEDTRAGS